VRDQGAAGYVDDADKEPPSRAMIVAFISQEAPDVPHDIIDHQRHERDDAEEYERARKSATLEAARRLEEERQDNHSEAERDHDVAEHEERVGVGSEFGATPDQQHADHRQADGIE